MLPPPSITTLAQRSQHLSPVKHRAGTTAWGRRRDIKKSLKKRPFAKITTGENPARSSQKQKAPVPQAMGYWVRPLGLQERQRGRR